MAQHAVANGMTDFVGLGRMVLAYPDLPADVLSGTKLRRKSICRTFSDCTTGPRLGMVSGCYPLVKRIAGELGVSITTVSKVLNNHDDISPATRARVMAKVEELGYRPNAVARSADPAAHPHARRRHPRSDALVLRRDHRGHRAGGQRARLRAAALQLGREPREGALGAAAAPRPSGRRHRPGVGARVGQHRDAAASCTRTAPAS